MENIEQLKDSSSTFARKLRVWVNDGISEAYEIIRCKLHTQVGLDSSGGTILVVVSSQILLAAILNNNLVDYTFQ